MNYRFTFLCMFALVGCNSDPAPLTQTEYCNEYAKDVCDGVEPACLITDASCMSLRLAECTNNAKAQYDLGRAFLPSNAEACLGKVSAFYGQLKQGKLALGVVDYRAMTAACNNVYRGTAVSYDACLNGDNDCIDGLVCDKGLCGHAKEITQGGCANIGETCSQGYYCSNAGVAYFCTAKVGLYGACGASLPCLENLRCSAAGICDVQLGMSVACSADQDCSTGFCDPYAGKCAQYIGFADGSAACLAMSGT
jgi:hypothetical protein